MSVSPSAEPKLLSHREAAQRLGVHPNALTAWIKRGWLAGVQGPRGARCFRESDVAALRDKVYAE